MKQLIIVRHAKSSWALSGQDDFDRPLNDRGHRDAPVMATRLVQKNIQIDAFVASPANRALTTAQYFAKAYGRKKEEVLQFPELYHALPATFYEVITQMDDRYTTVAIFSHNPGITAFANMLTNASIDDMPTCAVFGVSAETDSWRDFTDAVKSFWFFDYPKSV